MTHSLQCQSSPLQTCLGNLTLQLCVDSNVKSSCQCQTPKFVKKSFVFIQTIMSYYQTNKLNPLQNKPKAIAEVILVW